MHLEDETRDEECGQHAVERGVRCSDAESFHSPFVFVRMQRDEVEKDENRNGGEKGGEVDVARRVVVLKVHARVLRKSQVGVRKTNSAIGCSLKYAQSWKDATGHPVTDPTTIHREVQRDRRRGSLHFPSRTTADVRVRCAGELPRAPRSGRASALDGGSRRGGKARARAGAA